MVGRDRRRRAASRMHCPIASPNAAARHAVVESPSSARAARSSGVYVIVLPYARGLDRLDAALLRRRRARRSARRGTAARRASFGSVDERLLPRLLGVADVVEHRAPDAAPGCRFSSVTTSAASGATAARSAVGVGYDARVLRSTPAPSSSPTSATSTMPSPSPRDHQRVRRADSARTIGVGFVDRVHDDRVAAAARSRARRGRSRRPRPRRARASLRRRRRRPERRSACRGPGSARTRGRARAAHEVVALRTGCRCAARRRRCPCAAAARRRPAGSATPSWNRRSSALSRSAVPAVPYGISSRATYGRSMSPGVIGSTVLPHVYDAKSAPGSSSTRVVSPCASRYFDRLRPVRGHVLGPLEVLAVEACRRTSAGKFDDDQHARRRRSPRTPSTRLPAPPQPTATPR